MKLRNFLSILFLSAAIGATSISCSKDPVVTATGNAVTISDFAFTPASLSVAKGTTVTWTNNGATGHTVTSDAGTELGSLTIAPGTTYVHTFNTAGSFSYHCSIHSSMTAIITVTP